MVQPQRRAELPCLSWNSPWLCITETSRIWEMCFPCGYLQDKGNVTITVWVRTVKSQQLPQVFSRWGLDLRNCSRYFNINKFYVQSAVSKADFLAYLLCNVLIAFFFFFPRNDTRLVRLCSLVGAKKMLASENPLDS